MLRVVLDTNIIVSAYGFGGKPAEVMRAAIEGECLMLTSPALMAEVADKLYEVLGFDDEHVRATLAQIARVAEVVRPDIRVSRVADEDDNRMLECAIAGGADVVISGDHHLLDLGTHEGIEIQRAAAFLQSL